MLDQLRAGRWAVLGVWIVTMAVSNASTDRQASAADGDGDNGTLVAESELQGYVELRSDTADVPDKALEKGAIIAVPTEVAGTFWSELGFEPEGPSVLNKLAVRIQEDSLPPQAQVATLDPKGRFVLQFGNEKLILCVANGGPGKDAAPYDIMGCAVIGTAHLPRSLVIEIGIDGVTVNTDRTPSR
jgi:hypothetical protein